MRKGPGGPQTEVVASDDEAVNILLDEDERERPSSRVSASVPPAAPLSSRLPPPPPDRPRPRPKKSSGSARREHGRSGLSISRGVVTGALMMIGAVVWLVVGLFAGWIFFYPPILFVLGLIRFVTSLLGHEED